MDITGIKGNYVITITMNIRLVLVIIQVVEEGELVANLLGLVRMVICGLEQVEMG